MSIKTRLEKLEKVTGSKEKKSYSIFSVRKSNGDYALIDISEIRGGKCVRSIDGFSEEGKEILKKEGF